MHDKYATFFKYLQLIADLLVLNVAFMLAGTLRFDDLRVENQEYYNYYVQLFVFMNFAWVIVALLVKSHAFNAAQEIRKSMGKITNTLLLHGMVLALLLVSLKGYYYSRLFFTYFYIGFVPLVLVTRMLLIKYFRNFLRKDSHARKVVLLGHLGAAQQFYTEVAQHPEYGLRIVAWFAAENAPQTKPLSEAKSFIKTNHIAEIYCALAPDDEQIFLWRQFAEQNLLRFRYLPNLGLTNLTNTKLELLGQIPVLSMRKEPLEHWHNRVLKRAFDLVFSTVILLAIFPWLLPILAILIKASSPGPVFFKQERSGINNQKFWVYKFRTMRVNAAAHTQQATPQDPRITRIGSFLRKHNLDELPQFFNVLLNKMSVVGPRPHMLKHTKDYRKLIDQFMVRHLIKPGITGLAQTRGLRGETTHLNQMEERVKADVYYLENWSVWLDVKIVFDTVYNMLRGKSGGV